MTHKSLAKLFGWDQEPDQIESGAFLQPAELAALEAHLSDVSTVQADLLTSQGEVTNLQTQVTDLQNKLTASEGKAADLKKTNTDLTNRIAVLEKGSSGRRSHVAGAGTETEETTVASYNDPNSPINQFADKQLNASQNKSEGINYWD